MNSLTDIAKVGRCAKTFAKDYSHGICVWPFLSFFFFFLV